MDKKLNDLSGVTNFLQKKKNKIIIGLIIIGFTLFIIGAFSIMLLVIKQTIELITQV